MIKDNTVWDTVAASGRQLCFFSSVCFMLSRKIPVLLVLSVLRLILGFPASSSHDIFRDWQGCSGDREGCAVPLTPLSFHPGQGEQEQNRAPCPNRLLFLSCFLSKPAIFPFYTRVWVLMLQLSDLPMDGPLFIYKKAAYSVAAASVNGFLYLPTNLYYLKCNLKLSREIGSSYN